VSFNFRELNNWLQAAGSFRRPYAKVRNFINPALFRLGVMVALFS
jgi:hypothetical protein